jgi:hypothetical protein
LPPGIDGVGHGDMAHGQGCFKYAGLLFVIGAVPFLMGCAILAYAVFALPTRYPRWAIVFNPPLMYAVTLVFRYVPAPLGGPLYIGYGNIMFLTFFAASTAALWSGAPPEDDTPD